MTGIVTLHFRLDNKTRTGLVECILCEDTPFCSRFEQGDVAAVVCMDLDVDWLYLIL